MLDFKSTQGNKKCQNNIDLNSFEKLKRKIHDKDLVVPRVDKSNTVVVITTLDYSDKGFNSIRANNFIELDRNLV